MTNKLERGIVPEIGDLSLLPEQFVGQPTYAISGGNVSIAHVPVANVHEASLFQTFVRSNVLGQTVVEVVLCLADMQGVFRTVELQNKGNGGFELASSTTLQAWNQSPRSVDRYAFRITLNGGNSSFIGVSGISYAVFPLLNCILPGHPAIGSMPEQRLPTLVDIFGTTLPDPLFYNNEQSIYRMFNVIKNKFTGESAHTHNGVNSVKISHSNLAGITQNDHHNKLHGLEDHAGQIIGELSQVSGVTISTAELNSLANRDDNSLHYHNEDRNRFNHVGTQPEGSIVFSENGHNHEGGTTGQQILHSNLLNITENDHHAKEHGIGQHQGIIGTVEQIDGLAPSVNAAKLLELCGGGITSLHQHEPTSPIIELPLAESQIQFSSLVGHLHDGVTSTKIDPQNLNGCPDVTAEKLNKLCNGSLTSSHYHRNLDPNVIYGFGVAPEFANATIDNTAIIDCQGKWTTGCEANLAGHEGGFQTFLEWTTDLATLQASRLRIAVNIPNMFGVWTPQYPIYVWFKAIYNNPEDVGLQLSIKDSIGLTVYSGNIDPILSNGAWTQFVVPALPSGSFEPQSWFLVTLEAQARGTGNNIKIGRIDFKYKVNENG